MCFGFFVGVPKDLSYPLVRNALSSVTGVKSVHSLHIWSLTIDRNSAAVHLAIGIKNIYPDLSNFRIWD